jgi:hypothetical protein
MESPPTETSKIDLHCTLRPRTGLPSSQEKLLPAEVELFNQTNRPVRAIYSFHPLQYLRVVVEDDKGEVLGTSYWIDHFSPLGTTQEWTLSPGERYAVPLSLIAAIPSEKRRPGCYRFQAVYDSAELHAESNRLELVLRSDMIS